MASTLVGLFDDRSAAEGAVQDLVSAGVARDSISIVASDASGNVQTHDADGNLAAEGASAGISSGAVVGGIAGLLIGLGFTVLPIAGFLLAGPVAGLIAGAATGAVTGGVVGGLIGLGIPKEHAELYAEGVRRGGTLVTVSSSTVDDDRIRDILDRDGAVDIEERHNEWKSQGYTGYDASAPSSSNYTSSTTALDDTAARTDAANSGTVATGVTGSTYGTTPTTTNLTNETYAAPVGDKIEIVEEQLAVGKREVEKGGVRVRSFVTETPVSEQVTLREEHVDIQRTPVDRPVTGAAFTEGSIELRETAEVPVVAKEARVVEEISLNKTATERVETVNDTVRRTDVEVENVGGQDWNTRFRSHFTSSGATGNYEEYAPAYDYGRQIASSGTYADDFDTNETYRTQWESKNPGTWDKFKSSVRHAIDEVKGNNANTGNKANLY